MPDNEPQNEPIEWAEAERVETELVDDAPANRADIPIEFGNPGEIASAARSCSVAFLIIIAVALISCVALVISLVN